MHSAARTLALLPALLLAPALRAQTAPAASPTAPAAPAAQTAPAAPATTTPGQATPSPATTAPAPAPSPVKVEEQESFTVIGLTVRTNNAAEAGGQGQIPQLWQSAMASGQLDQVPNRVGDGMVVVYSDYAATGDYNYTLGVRVSSADKIPDGMVKRVIPAGKYAVVQSEAGVPEEVIPALWQRIAQMTPQEMGGTRAYQVDFETYLPITDPSNMQTTAHIGIK
jgi:predicted transcriptional regulator YdeE